MPYFPAQVNAQTLHVNAVVDSTVSTTITTLLTQQITTTTFNGLDIAFTACCSNSSTNTNVYFQIMVDGIIVERAAARYISTVTSCAMHIIIEDVVPGLHTILVRWNVSGGTGRLRPNASPTTEFATLVVSEFMS